MGEHVHDENCTEHPGPTAEVAVEVAVGPRSRWKSIRDSAGAAIGTVLGIVPHVMHHIGLLAGAALITGASGNALLYAVGLLFSVPMLRRIHRRFRTLWAPAIAVLVFTVLFSLSAFVIGPAISGSGEPEAPEQQPAPTQPTVPSHAGHHTD
jgi:hypothetical protein